MWSTDQGGLSSQSNQIDLSKFQSVKLKQITFSDRNEIYLEISNRQQEALCMVYLENTWYIFASGTEEISKNLKTYSLMKMKFQYFQILRTS